ncbi:MAG: RnfH family protein [Gammaproteobacteria bacterium]|nr:RnfH family protein [Gammaproteobacteria bacterium]
MAEEQTSIMVEVAYATPTEQQIFTVTLGSAATVQEAIELSGVLQAFPEIDLEKSDVGIFSKVAKLSATLRERDRIEIYRPLIADPKAVRKQRASEGKKMNKGGGEE